MLFNSKCNGLFTALGVFPPPPPPPCKIRSRHSRELILLGLIAYIICYKICYFESPTKTNDVIMTSLQKQWQKSDLRETKQIIYHSKVIDKSCPKMCFLLNLSHCVKNYGDFCQILALFTMPAHQIWPCHVVQGLNFKKCLFCPNSTFNISKSHKISSGKVFYFRSYQQKPHGGWKTRLPPVPLWLK